MGYAWTANQDSRSMGIFFLVALFFLFVCLHVLVFFTVTQIETNTHVHNPLFTSVYMSFALFLCIDATMWHTQ